MVVIAFMAFGFLSGDKGFINNYILEPLGGEDIAFYSEGKYWYIILPIVSAWKNLGYYCIIYYATILGIDDTLYESASLEGATGFQMFTKITVPLLKPTIITMTILQLGKSLILISAFLSGTYELQCDSFRYKCNQHLCL